jgi:hypothetical protein
MYESPKKHGKSTFLAESVHNARPDKWGGLAATKMSGDWISGL